MSLQAASHPEYLLTPTVVLAWLVFWLPISDALAFRDSALCAVEKVPMYTVLIAEPSDSIRITLKSFFVGYPQVSTVYEAITSSLVQQYTANLQLDLLIISQSLVTDVKLLPPGRFVIVASEYDHRLLQETYMHGGRGYLLATAPLELFGASLSLREGQFLYDPTFIFADLSERFFERNRFVAGEKALSVAKLTAREQEIFSLARAGFSYHSIAVQLNISKETVKTHIAHIHRKLDLVGRGTRIRIQLPERKGKHLE